MISLDGQAFCKCSSGLTSIWQMTIPMAQPLATWSSGWTGLLQMIIRMDWAFVNDHQDGVVSSKRSSGWTGLLQIIFRIDMPLANDHPDGPAFCKWSSFSFSKYFPPLPLLSIFSPTKDMFSVSKITPHFSFPVLFSSEKVCFPSPNIFFLFHLRYIFPQQKRIPSLNIILLFLFCSSSPPETQNSKF